MPASRVPTRISPQTSLDPQPQPGSGDLIEDDFGPGCVQLGIQLLHLKARTPVTWARPGTPRLTVHQSYPPFTEINEDQKLEGIEKDGSIWGIPVLALWAL